MTARVERHTGGRGALRPLFALAEDSQMQLDSYLDDGEVLVAFADDRIVGHLQLVEAAGAGRSEIKNMAVDPAQRRRGVGRLLIDAAVDRERGRGRSTLVVAAAAADTGNLRFYQRAGFRLRSVERDAFTAETGYPEHTCVDGIELRDRVWLELEIGAVIEIRDARPGEALALESLQRRSSDVWEDTRDQLAAHPDAIAPPHEAIAEGRVRVAVEASGRRLGFSVVLPLEDGRCELDDLFVEPDSMRRGVGRMLVEDVAGRAAAAGGHHVDVIANPNALGFYERVGFEVTGRASTRFGDAPRMTLDLSRR